MKKSLLTYLILIFIFINFSDIYTQVGTKSKSEVKDPMNSSVFGGLKLRSIGPALASGRVSDLAVNPNNFDMIYVAVACGNIWKTTNHGCNWIPIFDNYPSFSIGCLAIDPNNEHVIWAGTGENNSQRSVSWGDGVYKSIDGGKSWKNMGLNKSEHIGKILIDPKNSDIIYVAAQGPLWGPGGDRGLYKSTDGGESWEKSLYISENTGVSDIVMDPRDNNVLYCSAYQRRRHVWTLINGGPEGAVYKTTDAGKKWTKLANGLPSGFVGRIGLAIPPANPDIVYALVEASEDRSGFYKSTNRGASWEKMSSYNSQSPQYYQEIVCDPINPDKVYSLDTYTQVTIDGGRTWSRLGGKERHVDDHALWINPNNTEHLIIGGDGGIYETWDGGKAWRFFENLPITQFYRVGVDNDFPFYNVYGGTQDNATIGGPSRTVNYGGIMNQDWFFTKEGDGFQSRIDPNDPNIVYSQAQYGSLVRFDKKSGQRVDIKPFEEKYEELRWNWDSPLIISPHSPTRLYFAANKLFRSDDRGNSWRKVSPDLTRQINRNQLQVMGRIWEPEAVAKNASTSLYGNIVSLCESPLKENLIFVGTDDGLIQVTENGGENWKIIERFTGIPNRTYVSDLIASQHNENVIYACFDNHKMADFKPYVLKSSDKGNSWVSISANLPENGPVYAIVEDHINKDLLFVGTEFGLFFTIDGGKKWIQLKSGLPTIAVRDLEIQKRENDLVLATFGRGFYILDDYSPLRQLNENIINSEAHLFPARDAWMYIENISVGGRRDFGETFYRADNPEFGATITYYLKEAVKTKKSKRIDEAKAIRDKGENPPYPSFEQLREEELEEKPYLLFEISSIDGSVIRKMTAAASSGIQRITWDLCHDDTKPLSERTNFNKYSGMPAIPGIYSVNMYKFVDGIFTKIAGPVQINTKVLQNASLPAKNVEVLNVFYKELQEIQRAAYAADKSYQELKSTVEIIRKTVTAASNADIKLKTDAAALTKELIEVELILYGNKTLQNRNENESPSVFGRLGRMFYYTWGNLSDPPESYKTNLIIAENDLRIAIEKLREISEFSIKNINRQLDEIKAPWTPGRIPEIRK